MGKFKGHFCAPGASSADESLQCSCDPNKSSSPRSGGASKYQAPARNSTMASSFGSPSPAACRCPPQEMGDMQDECPDFIPDFVAAKKQIAGIDKEEVEYRFFENQLLNHWALFEESSYWQEKEKLLDQLDFIEADEILGNLRQYQRCRRRLDYDSSHLAVPEP